jgi:nitroimidazol reductase NimA-like FMN-containing flavoprotein (pyridoxamine 5'-phosphate oxidase superfamily)
MARLQELDVETSMRLLREHRIGRLALNDEGGPLVFPVNYAFDAGQIVFRSDLGTKLRAAEGRLPASFQIDHADERLQSGWSVLVRGRLSEVADPAEIARLDALQIEPFDPGQGKLHLVRLEPRVITGRRLPLPPGTPPGWYRSIVQDTSAFGSNGE